MRCERFEECGRCINRELDPFECEDCDDASNFEPDDEYEEDSLESQELTYGEFIEFMREAA